MMVTVFVFILLISKLVIFWTIVFGKFGVGGIVVFWEDKYVFIGFNWSVVLLIGPVFFWLEE